MTVLFDRTGPVFPTPFVLGVPRAVSAQPPRAMNGRWVIVNVLWEPTPR